MIALARHADHPGRLDKLTLLEGHELAANHPGQPHPAKHRQKDHDVGDGDAVQQRSHDQQQEDARERQHQVDEPHQDRIDPATVIPGDRTDDDANHDRDNRGRNANRQ